MLALPAAQAQEGDDELRGRGPGGGADFSTAPRVDVHKPVQLIPLYLRDPRIHGLQPFQELVDKTPEGGVLKVPAGHYSGPVHLKKRMVIEAAGDGEVVIDGGDKGTVFVLETNEATLRNLTITGSGESHDSDDACLNVRGHGNLMEGLKNLLHLLGLDADSCVLDLDDDLLRSRFAPDPNGPPLRKLDRIAEQIQEDLPDPLRIAGNGF